MSHSPATFRLCVLKVKGPLSVGPRPVRPEPPLTCFSPLHWLGKLWDLRCSPSLCGFCLTSYPSVAILSPVLFPYQFSWKHFLIYSLKACSQGLVDVRHHKNKGTTRGKEGTWPNMASSTHSPAENCSLNLGMSPTGSPMKKLSPFILHFAKSYLTDKYLGFFFHPECGKQCFTLAKNVTYLYEIFGKKIKASESV